MRPLVAVRRAAAFNPHFAARHALFWPLERAARALDGCDDFPPPEALGAVFKGDPPVRFVAATPRRRRGTALDVRKLYDARIVLDGEVPTRPSCWHDLMNALVWGTFPSAKRALHARQHRAIAGRLAPGARTLPAARTPELDALALLDEGGVVVLPVAPDDTQPSSAKTTIVFGHAIYESLALGIAPAVVAAITLAVDCQESNLLQAVDRALAAAIEDETMLRTPSELSRMQITTAARVRGSTQALGEIV